MAIEAEEKGEKVLSVNGLSMRASEVEAKLDEGDIQEAESSLREGLALNFEEARALLGRLEYQRGNVEAALRVFDGIDLQAAIERLQSSPAPSSKKKGSRSDSLHSISHSQHAAGLVLEAIYLKAVSLQKLGKSSEAAGECKSVLDAVEKMFQNGISDKSVDTKLQDTITKTVELLPELYKQSGMFQEALASYRRALLTNWNLSHDRLAGIQKRFAVLLLHGGVEAGSPSLASQTDGSFVPKNNLEESILLLTVLLKKSQLGKIPFDRSVLEHLTFALSMCNGTSVLARLFEELLPGTVPRRDRWNDMALCYAGAGDNGTASNLLKKSLNGFEDPDNVTGLLLAAKVSEEGTDYARRALKNCLGGDEHLKGVALHLLGVCLGKRARAASSDQERARLQAEALRSLNEAVGLDRRNPDLVYDLGFEYAVHRNMNGALRCAKEFIDATGGSVGKGWRLLALVLSAQRRFLEAGAVVDAALDETAKWEQGELLRIKANLKVAQSLPTDAVEAYRLLLALVQARRKSLGSLKTALQAEDEKVREFEVWQGLASLYSTLSYWKDVDICLDKARALKPYSASILHTQGCMQEARAELHKALASYSSSLLMESDFVPCKVSIGSLLWKTGSKSLPVSRSFLSDALRIEPTNQKAWYYLGMVHREDGRLSDAADCFQAAAMLEESDPVENFTSIQ